MPLATTRTFSPSKPGSSSGSKSLKAPDSWLSLAGLFWLKEGSNTFGTAQGNDFLIEKDRTPARIGAFILESGKVRFRAEKEVPVLCQGQPANDIEMADDSSRAPTTLRLGPLSWLIIKRGDRLGVRVKDAENPRIAQLQSIDSFAIDPAWKLEAVLEKYPEPKKIATRTVIGTVEEQASPGVLVFTFRGVRYRLLPWTAGNDLFVVFGDQTNGLETYGGGRFLTVKKPDARGKTVIDFNMAYNPPCVFSSYATCPLPAPANRLPLRITAGEKMVRGFGH